MICKDCQEWIDGYFRGDADLSLIPEFEAHSEDCPDCTKDAASMNECFEWLRKTFPEEVPPSDLWERLCEWVSE